MIDLYYAGTPNGQKVAIMLEETGQPYKVHTVDIFEGEQLTPEFGEINPNHRIPAIVDHAPADSGPPLKVFESGAILQYLAEKTGQFLPSDARGRSVVVQWLTWQMSAVGPMFGQWSHFARYAPPGQDYAISRYSKEAIRLLNILERRLREVPYVGGPDYSIADIAIWPGRASANAPEVNDPAFGATQEWMERVRCRPAVERTMSREELKMPAKYIGSRQSLTKEQWSNVFGDKQHEAVKQK